MKKTYNIKFGKLHNLSTFTHQGHTYRKVGNLAAIREDEKESVFYPNEFVTICPSRAQPPRTTQLWQVGDSATITMPELSFSLVELTAGEAREFGNEPNTLVSVVRWG